MTRSAAVAALALAAVLASAGCAAPSGAPATSPPSSPPVEPSVSSTPLAVERVTLGRTGGLAGVDQLLVVGADGSWAYSDTRVGGTQEGRLSPTEWDRLRRLVTAPALREEATRSLPPRGCADYFTYVLMVDKLTVTAFDCGEDDLPATAEVIAFLSEATPL